MPEDFGIFNSVFSNAKSNYTGFITVTSGGNLLMVNCNLTNLSRSKRGGSLFIDGGSSVLIKQSNFSSCTASSEGGCIFVGIESHLELYSVNFRDSIAEAGAFLYAKEATLILNNCVLFGGAASYGGLLYSLLAILNINDCKFLDGKASRRGGGLMIVESKRLFLKNSSFENNRAEEDGGALYLDSCDIINFKELNLKFNIANLKGTVYIIGKNGVDYQIDSFLCDNNRALFGTCVYQTDGNIIISNGTITNNKDFSNSFLDFRSIFDTIILFSCAAKINSF